MAAREGNLRDLQSALDRRKFAVARDGSSPRGATPLHVAVVFGNTAIIRYTGVRHAMVLIKKQLFFTKVCFFIS